MAQMLVHTAFNLLINPTSSPLRFEAGLQVIPDDLVGHWYVKEHATLVGAEPVQAEPEAVEPEPQTALEPAPEQAADVVADPAEPEAAADKTEEPQEQPVEAVEPEPIPEDWAGLHWTQKVALAKRLAPEAADIDSQTAGDIIAAEIARRSEGAAQ